jgi:hypothetical protein
VLAGGLYLAVHGVCAKEKPEEKVTATGVWKDGVGIQPVTGLRQKLEAAARHGAKTVFVPEEQRGEAHELAPPGLAIGTLKRNEPNPVETLRDYLVALEARPLRPTTPDDLPPCVDYYHRLQLRPELAADYYWSDLLDVVAELGRLELANLVVGGPLPSVTHLVTFASGATELIPLAARILGVNTVLVLHTTPEPPTNALKQLETTVKTIVPKRVPMDTIHEMVRKITTHIEEFAPTVPAEKLVLDITPGTSLQKVTADHAMRRGAWRFFLNPDYREALRGVIPGNEKPIVWRVK